MKPSIGSCLRLFSALALGAATLSACVVARPPEFARRGGEEPRTTEEKIRAAIEEKREEWKKKFEEREAKTAAREREQLFTEIDTQLQAAARELRFASGSTRVPMTARQELQRLGRLLSRKGAEEARIRLEGYTDSKGSTAANLLLAEQRAQAVRRILLDNGARISQLEVEGRGNENPVASNMTEDGRALNRRVEMEMTASPAG
jgi:outer membrane protein OmpA-like peptidoglycan-associated protein